MALLGFIGFLSMSSQRMCIAVALICMLNQTALTETGAALTLQPTPVPAVTAAGNTSGPPINGDRQDNVTAAGARVVDAKERPASACGEIPEIFVLNTSDFSRVKVSSFDVV